MSLFDLKIWSVEGEIFAGRASLLKLKAVDGELEILTGHIPYINALSAGKIEFVKEDGNKMVLQADSGFVKVEKNNHVYVFIQTPICVG
ncbi:hypothetical protein A3J90_04545 [candidate division WOR-1 bacterium RIFOXYC2_FULL_37_10]|uniref:ATP synthase F1 complex delta/epsilon subunit N-terminal domain-containing protein n=1 Tax=candidate division WOR-1 bacterium RIFOXYB2_FULL_37_13 TaxID=1802579 RepID=A0A1F4SWG2_UNCSA|nr:MAG: hypothetical protein A2246_02765 [candidate division WOR-1 bacterium RIFOXYA2_FULL_37_7]OGC24760.1 MAG: hypothetical protein A2310_04695 [candidate division WOR-1 bacterium RIFOXYB2_FULL_37_13]OGC33627.1 MAG: hypothetical protein A3J90_04545 [candidate division WOR-1 bacterium RIFOXYC2_FULL_37_10]